MENKYRDLHELPVTLRVEDLRPILGIGRNTAYELIRSGQIRSVRIGRQTGSSNSPVLKAPKTESSVRKVFLPKTVSMALTEEKDRQQRAKEMLDSDYQDFGLVIAHEDGRPYEVFTGKIEEDAMYIPRKINKGFIIKVREDDGTKRYDFQYTDRYGYTNTIGGISRLFDEEFWNYAKLISGVLRHGMPIEKTVSLIESLHLDSESINTWKTGVCRALKQYIVDGTKSKGKCPSCGQENMAYQNGCLTCMSCGYSKCG